MSATIVRDRRQVTLPAEVCEPARIEVGDQIDWRFEADEIRGRKLAPVTPRRNTARLVRDRQTGLVYFDAEMTYEEMESAALRRKPGGAAGEDAGKPVTALNKIAGSGH